jgi:hypothetical protein
VAGSPTPRALDRHAVRRSFARDLSTSVDRPNLGRPSVRPDPLVAGEDELVLRSEQRLPRVPRRGFDRWLSHEAVARAPERRSAAGRGREDRAQHPDGSRPVHLRQHRWRRTVVQLTGSPFGWLPTTGGSIRGTGGPSLAHVGGPLATLSSAFGRQLRVRHLHAQMMERELERERERERRELLDQAWHETHEKTGHGAPRTGDGPNGWRAWASH